MGALPDRPDTAVKVRGIAASHDTPGLSVRRTGAPESPTTARPWNTSALASVERLNGRAAMVGFMAAVAGELVSGKGIVGQRTAVVRWYLSWAER